MEIKIIVEIVLSLGILTLFVYMLWLFNPKHPERAENLCKKIFH